MARVSNIKIAASVFGACFTDVFFGCLLKFSSFQRTSSSRFIRSPPLEQLWFRCIPFARTPNRSTKDYVLVYAQSTLAEQSTPAYIAIIDSDMPVTNIIWVGEDWYLESVGLHFSRRFQSESFEISIHTLQEYGFYVILYTFVSRYSLLYTLP